MCGIVGVFNLNGEPFALSNLKQMAETIAHRGPDGDGYYVDNQIGLAHKRLAILDVSNKGAQPMTSKDGNWVITFNGCIIIIWNYNRSLNQRDMSLFLRQILK